MDWQGKRAFIADAQGNIHAFSAEEKGSDEITTFSTNPPSIETRLRTIADLIKGGKAEDEIAGLKASEKHWNAAALNTRALRTAVETQALSARGEEDIGGFLQSLAAVDGASAALIERRNLRDQLAKTIESKTLPEIHREEGLATLQSLDASVKNLADNLREKENAISSARQSAEVTLSNFHISKTEEGRLREAYLQALK